MTTTPLTPAQHAILAKAIHTSGGKIDWFPDHIKGGARKKVLEGLFKRALITPDDDGWCIAAEGFDALGMARPAPTTASQAPQQPMPASQDEAALEADVAATEATFTRSVERTQRAPRPNTKTSRLLALLEGEGVGMDELCAASGWQPHSVRGFLANLRKTLPAICRRVKRGGAAPSS